MSEEIVNWDEATTDGKFVKLEQDKPVQLTIVNWKLIKTIKDFSGKPEEKVEFTAEVTKFEAVECEKTFNTVSNRLKQKLKAVLENKVPTEPVNLRITKIGSAFNTNYSVVED